jgi:hypothetical protein
VQNVAVHDHMQKKTENKRNLSGKNLNVILKRNLTEHRM